MKSIISTILFLTAATIGLGATSAEASSPRFVQTAGWWPSDCDDGDYDDCDDYDDDCDDDYDDDDCDYEC